MPLLPPDTPTFTDQLQGWGSLVAAVAAVIGLGVTIWIAVRDQKAGEEQRKEDRADADRRLAEERQAAAENLQRQLDEQRDRDRRYFLIQQLQQSGDLYAEYKGTQREFRPGLGPDDPGRRHAERIAVQRLRACLATIPSPYASLLRVEVFGSSTAEKATLVVDEASRREARRRVPDPDNDGVGSIGDEEIYREIADNIDELLGRKAPPDE
ncbi:hypothetical protein OG320_05405 [Microbispora sp. NBC_01189]|uniref:hypothetical protein n=1 Tax=Microbispora sp. NBC_01189 TaxID=2903583 RepID=UPI002E0F019D|nr:hypothetical protein OG320_05405 [Microbispora sp. NBC_01189]